MTQNYPVLDLPLDMNNLQFQVSNLEPKWGPTGKEVYERTYQRIKPDGTKETWDDTVRRVVKGNLGLVSEDRTFPGEEEELYDLIYNFRAIPAGRHLWMSGVEGRQFLFNCYVSGWGDRLSEHFAFTFNQLMEGGGVGSNYSQKYIGRYPIFNLVTIHIVCSPEHDNYRDLLDAGLLSSEYTNEWTGSYEVDDSREGWTEALTRVIDLATQYQPDDAELDHSVGEYLPTIVIDVSNIRAAGKRIKTFGGTSAGPVPFSKMIKQIGHLLGAAWESEFNGPIAMEMDHAIATCVVSGNVRRSARMSIMRWDDAWIDWFLKCKESGFDHWSTNISVEIDDTFIAALNGQSGNPGMDDHAAEVYDMIIQGMLSNGEPGIWNSDYANVGEPHRVISTNPCGEIALEPWENCNLGHINLDSFVLPNGDVDVDGLVRAHQLITRFLIRATYGDITDEKTQDVVLRNRRIGVGHFGYAGFLAKQQILFSESWNNNDIKILLEYLKGTVNREAINYAHVLRIPVPVKTTTVAPTGTIAKLAGRSEGIHPIFARYFIRRIRYSEVDPVQATKIEEFRAMGFNLVEDPSTPYTMVVEIPTKEALVQELEDLGIDPKYLQSADEIGLYDMLKVQEMYQTLWANNAVSYTINIQPYSITPVFLGETLKPFLGQLKGTTIFPEKGYVLPPYQRLTEVEYEALRASQAVSAVSDSIDEDCASGACPVR